MKVQTLSAKNLFIQGESQAMRACRGGKRSLKGWFAEFVLTIKKVCAHEKKRLHLTRKKVSPHERKLPTWIFTRPLVVLVRTFS